VLAVLNNDVEAANPDWLAPLVKIALNRALMLSV
jgi:hypothetical protein